MNSKWGHILANYTPIALVRYPVHAPAHTMVKGLMQGRAFSPIKCLLGGVMSPPFNIFHSGRHFLNLRSFLPVTAFKDNMMWFFFSCLLHPTHIQACLFSHPSTTAQMAILGMAMSLVLVMVDPCQGTGIAATKALLLVTATCPGWPPIPEGAMIPLQSPNRGTTIKEQPIHKWAMDSNLGTVATWNAIDPVILGMVNTGLIRWSLSLLVCHSLPRGTSLTCQRLGSTYFFGVFFFIYCYIFLHSPTSNVSALHSRAHGMLWFLGPFIHVQSTFHEGSRLASTVATPPDASST